VLIAAPRRNFCLETRDREGAIGSTRGACAPQRARLSERRRSVRAHAPNQFNERRPAGWPGLECCWEERNFWRRQNCKPVEGKIDLNEIGSCRCQNLGGCCRDGTKNFATFSPGGLRLGFGRLGMERTTALGRIRFCGERAKRAMIGNRDPGTNRQRDDHATRGCFHIASIVDAAQMLKSFLLDPGSGRSARKEYFLVARHREGEE
jgi:hypothetical protein